MKIQSQWLIDTFSNPAFYPQAVDHVELVETHISWVFLTGNYVYKIKKPVDMGFLDFSTLEKRKFYCNEEIRVNRRLAPDYYLDVVYVTETSEGLILNGNGKIIEYAVRMRQFPQQAQLDRILARNELDGHHMLLLAEKIADFHQKIAVADERMLFGNANQVLQPVIDCFNTILEKTQQHKDRVLNLMQWSNITFNKLNEVFTQRKQQGFIRECHGDLHLRNIAIDNDEVIAFDGIEFSEILRWNDVISEIAFLMMDLDDHHRSDLAFVFLNRYLQITGDYAGLKVMPFYLVYRAIVRAMVSCIRLDQPNLSSKERETEQNNFLDYLTLAESYVQDRRPNMILTYGLSGSGKSWLADKLAQLLPAVHIRSDIERKRLHSLAVTDRDQSGVKQGIYTATASDQTYSRLQQLAIQISQAGYNVIVDATFLEEHRQQTFIQCAKELSVPLRIIHCYAPVEILKKRVSQRLAENKDASDADLNVLEYQLQHQHLIAEDSNIKVLEVNTSEPLKIDWLIREIKKA